jgi:MFS family permease
MAGKLACGFLAERIGVVRTIVLTEIGTGAGILLLLVLPDIAAYLLLPVIGIALNGTSSALYATIGDLVEPDKLPRAFGLFYTLGSTCGLITPLALGVLGDAIGVADAMIVTALLAFLTLPACLVLRPALQALRAQR